MSAKTAKVIKKRRQQLVDFSSIKIEEGIPVPEDAESTNFRACYPLPQLKAGESFSFPVVRGNVERQVASVKSAISHHRGNNPHKNFVVKVCSDVVRVWRIEDSGKQ